jgi:uncharacterized membrane protein YjjP (DUF1212 family)
MGSRYSLTKFLHIFIIISIVSSYAFLSYYYYRGVLTINQFFVASITALLAISSVITLLKPIQRKNTPPNLNLKWLIYVLPGTVLVLAIVDIYLFKHLSMLSILSLITIFMVLTLSR